MAKIPALISIVIPTFHRGKVLLETLASLFEQRPSFNELIIVDQTPEHAEAVDIQLSDWQAKGFIVWVRMDHPTITGAMNKGLQLANSELVLFLDDDIVPSKNLVAAHAANYSDPAIWAVVGQVLQPGQEPDDELPPPYPGPGLLTDLEFGFNGTHPRQIYNCMAGNLSVRRTKAIEAGGMDMNFKGVAHRFETEFARRLTRAGGKVMFDPSASLRHLQAPSGGTRTYGNHLTSAHPAHSMGEYYMAFREARGLQRYRYMLQRMWRSVRTRFHVRRPWWIPVKLAGEIRGLFWAWRLNRQGPKYISMDNPDS